MILGPPAWGSGHPINWPSDSGFGSYSITTPQNRRPPPKQSTRRGRKTRCVHSALFVSLLGSKEGGVPASSPQPIPSVTQSQKETVAPGAVSSWYCKPMALLLLRFPSPPFSPELRARDGHFPLWLCPKGRNIFLWLTKTKGEMRKQEEVWWGLR